MMKYVPQFLLTASLIIFSTACLLAQSTSDELKIYMARDYKGALVLCQKIAADKPSPYVYSMIGQCYLKLDSTQKAKEAFLMNLKLNTSQVDWIVNLNLFQSGGFLARIYLNEKDYRNALNYFQLSARGFKSGDFGELARNFDLYNSASQARCYDALGKTDTAIAMVQPYVFKQPIGISELGYTNFYFTKSDSVQRDSASALYLQLLQKKYTNHQIKAEFQKIERSFNFQKEILPQNNGRVLVHFLDSISVYGQIIIIHSYGEIVSGDKIDEYKTPRDETREFRLNQFHKLPILKLVNALPN